MDVHAEYRQDFEAWLDVLGERWGVAFDLDGYGMTTWEADDDTSILIEHPEGEPYLHFCASVCEIPGNMLVSYVLSAKCLELNNFVEVTDGFVIGMSQELGDYLLSGRIEIGSCSEVLFAERLERFRGVLDDLRKELSLTVDAVGEDLRLVDMKEFSEELKMKEELDE